MSKRGRIIILSGPSGAGKTTLHEKLLASPVFKRCLVRSLSATTRPARPGEKQGRDYLFLSREEFEAKEKAGDFLESMKVFDNYYGTPKDKVDAAIKKGKNVLLCIDVKGAKVVSQKCPDALKIFVKTPNLTILKQRLKNRGTEDAQVLKLRLQVAKAELKEARQYNHVIVNDRLDRSYRELERVILAEMSLS